MASFDWSNGRLLTLTPGDTATAQNLNQGQIYALFFYNSANADASTRVVVTGNNSGPTLFVEVPGTTANQGLASLVFFRGSEFQTVSAAVLRNNPGAQIQAFIGSVKMPLDTDGINNIQLPLDGQSFPFEKFTRYFAVPESHRYIATLQSNINVFISTQFTQSKAEVIIVNAKDNSEANVYYLGDSKGDVTVHTTTNTSYSWSLMGNGTQFVWINADSVQNSEEATISVQSLSSLYA